MLNAKAVNEKLLNQKLFRKLKVETIMNGDIEEQGAWAIIVRFPNRGHYSSLTRKQVEPLRKELEKDLRSWRRIVKVVRAR